MAATFAMVDSLKGWRVALQRAAKPHLSARRLPRSYPTRPLAEVSKDVTLRPREGLGLRYSASMPILAMSVPT